MRLILFCFFFFKIYHMKQSKVKMRWHNEPSVSAHFSIILNGKYEKQLVLLANNLCLSSPEGSCYFTHFDGHHHMKFSATFRFYANENAVNVMFSPPCPTYTSQCSIRLAKCYKKREQSFWFYCQHVDRSGRRMRKQAGGDDGGG